MRGSKCALRSFTKSSGLFLMACSKKLRIYYFRNMRIVYLSSLSGVELSKEDLFKVNTLRDLLHDSEWINGRDDFLDCVSISSADRLDQNGKLK